MDEVMLKIAGEITLSRNPGASMKKWREIFGVTQTELAKSLEISSSTISDYESNRRKSPGIAVIQRFVHKLVDMDRQRGGNVSKRMEEKDRGSIFELHEFPAAVAADDFVGLIKGKPITNKRKLSAATINGFSIIDSLRAILELPADEFSQIYGSSTNRALIFTKVGLGRSPMVAIRVTQFKPTLVVFQGLQEVDALAKKISEIEKIPIVLTEMPVDEIIKQLKPLEGA